MREAAFVKKNIYRWKIFERIIQSGKISEETKMRAGKPMNVLPNDSLPPNWELLSSNWIDAKKVDPDTLAEMFIQLTDDLSYSRTFYPESKTTVYLNNMASAIHQNIYKNKKENTSRLVTFWTRELPLMFRSAHPQLLLSFVVFALAVLIGAVSTLHDENFPRLILGDGYVNMTLENIRKGDPMAVYKSHGQADMFFAITYNNVRVAFITFVSGVMSSIGTLFVLVQNGIMLGAFQTFFYNEGLFLTSFLAVWIHGTLEISVIIIAGAAGFQMGNSLLFPGTYSRLTSFRMGAKRGLKIVVGTVPIFIVAGFLEGFVTRLTDMPTFLKVAIIASSAGFIVWYYVIYPIRLSRRATYDQESELGQGIS
jgi:uncharacterized membrane protein SpoIIM required for sporulation